MTASELDILRAEVATLGDLLAVYEEQATSQFEVIRAQRQDLEDRTRSLDALNAELTDAAAFLRELHRTLPGLLIVCGASGLIERANDVAVTMLGYTEAELLGAPIANVLEANVAFGVDALLQRALRAEIDLVTRTGARVPVLLSAAVFGSDAPASHRCKLVYVAIDISERKRLEVELRHAQKLESIGRLAAGVAHEINTPVQFVTDSVYFLRDATTEVFGVLEKLQGVPCALPMDAPPNARAAGARSAHGDVDLPYILDNVPKAFDRCLDGLDRVATIVRSMKEFAHPHSRVMSEVDLNRAVETTLTIARSEYKYVADLETEFGDLPLVPCYVGDVNQVVLNIVVNAAHAIADRVAGTDERGRICVRTRCERDRVVIEIGDTGGGIPDQVRGRIFDPFFTTKEVGKGTGQGLAIARQIVVERHGGELSFDSVVGTGTKFFIKLPLEPAAGGIAPIEDGRSAAAVTGG